MGTLYDNEFGDIQIRRSRLSRDIKFSVAPTGHIRVAAPSNTPLLMIKHAIATSRRQIRTLMLHAERPVYESGMTIGKSHQLQLNAGRDLNVHHLGLLISVTYPADTFPESPQVQNFVRAEIIKALRNEAKHYLPKRLAYLANQHGFSYQSTRFTHASSRWGSCSSNGTISLNIALMTLPFDLIDYVLVHELCHTRQMNHSQEFWRLVASIYPDYEVRRKKLKKHSPIC